MIVTLDRGTLAKIDRRVFAELAHATGSQAVKVPVSDAVWSTWRRYCDAIGLSMGEGVAALIAHELETVVSQDTRDVFAGQAARQAAEMASQLDARKRQLDASDQRMREKEAHLRAWERRLQAQRISVPPARTVTKVGRNERCPCGSGLKYKRCHGLADAQTDGGVW